MCFTFFERPKKLQFWTILDGCISSNFGKKKCINQSCLRKIGRVKKAKHLKFIFKYVFQSLYFHPKIEIQIQGYLVLPPWKRNQTVYVYTFYEQDKIIDSHCGLLCVLKSQ